MEDSRMRFNPNCTNYTDTLDYINNSAIKFLKFGISTSYKTYEYNNIAVISIFKASDGSDLVGIYLYSQYRNKGLYKEIWTDIGCPVIVTFEECNLVPYLKHHNIKYVCYKHNEVYNIMAKYYGDKITKRSGLHLMNHIDDGLAILEAMNASQDTKDAFVIHPMLQADEALFENRNNAGLLYYIKPKVLLLAMEYRKTAMHFLPKHMLIENIHPIKSVLNEVNLMLIADKIQNQKDFNIYHKGTHENSKNLEDYYEMWLVVLHDSFLVQKFDANLNKEINYNTLKNCIKLNNETVFFV